ncbi:MAG: phosphonoacetaldehyde hydrolase [Gemmatimonadota bacterium]
MDVALAVFDMIGTTVEAGDEVPAAFAAALAGVGIRPSPEDLSAVRGRSKREAFAALVAGHGPAGDDPAGLADAAYRRFQGLIRQAYRERARPIPGVESVFAYFREAGVPVVLTTGFDRETAGLLLDAMGWEGAGLRGLITGDDVSRGRPAPDLIRAAMALTDIGDPRAVLVAGDTTADLEAAAAAGVGWNVGVLSGAHGRDALASRPHTVILESLADLPAWLSAPTR